MYSTNSPPNVPAVIPIGILFAVGVAALWMGLVEGSSFSVVGGMMLVGTGCYLAGKLMRAKSIDQNNSRE